MIGVSTTRTRAVTRFVPLAALVAATFVSFPVAASGTSSRANALHALEDLHLLVKDGQVSLAEYDPKLVDAKLVVYRYLEDAKAGAAKVEIATAMDYFLFASVAWHEKIDTDENLYQLGANPLVQQCAVLTVAIKQLQNSTDTSPDSTLSTEEQSGIAIELEIPTIFLCAQEHVEAAKHLIEGSRG